MSNSSHLDGPAFRALSAGAACPIPEEPDQRRPARDRIWELAETLHCSIVGTCLSLADGRALLAKIGEPDARTMSEHRLHGRIVHLAGRREGGGKLLQKMLDRRHEREIKRFDKARSTAEVRALWRESLEHGEIPGAYWAAMTHPATDWTLVQDIFGEVHMLSHLVGQSNRADIRRLRQLESDLTERDEALAAQAFRIRALTDERDGLSARNRAIESDQAVSAARRPAETAREPEAAGVWEMRLARERAHARALEEKLAALRQACERLGAALESEIAERSGAEAELAAMESVLSLETGDVTAAASVACLEGRRFLYVGGRPRQVAHLRRFVAARGGRLLDHDGGLEHSLGLLAGLVGQSDLVLFPTACVSHEATALVKRHCEATGVPYRPVRSASLASFVQAVASGP